MKRSLWTLGCVGLIALGGCAGSKGVVVKNTKSSAYYYMISELDLRRNDFQRALQDLNHAMEADKDNAYLQYKRANLYAILGDLEKAEADAQKSLEKDPQNFEALVLLGKLRQSQSRLPEAVGYYQRALKIQSDSEEVNSLILESYVAQKDEKSAVATVKKWESLVPENTTPFFYEAWVHQSFSKPAEASIAVYEKILDIDPENTKALSALADLYIESRQERRALDIFKQMEVLNPSDVSLKLKMALLYYQHKQFDQAVEKFQQLTELHPNDDRITYYLAVVYEGLKREELAESQFQKVSVKSPFFKDAVLHRAYLQIKANNKDGAKVVLQDALRSKSDEGSLYEYLAEILRDQEDLDGAVEVLKHGLKKSKAPDREALYYSLGMTYDRQGEFDKTIAAMREVLKRNPQNANAMNYIGYSYADRNIHIDEALELLQKALVLKPGDGYIMDSLGWAYYRKGDLDKALEYISKAYEKTPNEPTVTEHLGDISLKQNNPKKALKYFREAVGHLEKVKTTRALEDKTRLLQKIKELQ